ncbi:unnamed protein product [Brachionus calyciflorus]|uniref:Reverse transcriptase domain-containing protein n=1 Tax=Brachionus calyciflorus TaxID=104777 RepID=A0A814G2J9_9BILA|nr:unnamed protein product [Brachionus calyciflorus]
MQNQNKIQIEIEDFKKEVIKINSILSLIISPLKNKSLADINPNRPYFKPVNNLIDLDSFFKLSILKLIDDEHFSRDQRKSKIVIIGLLKTDNDQRTINRLFKSLKQPMPISFERLKSRRSRSNFPEPVICELVDVFHVEKILKESYKLKSFEEFQNVYVNPSLTINERILNSLGKKINNNKKYAKAKYSPNHLLSEKNFSQNLNKSTAGPGKQDQCTSAKLPNSSFNQNNAQSDSNKSNLVLSSTNLKLSEQNFSQNLNKSTAGPGKLPDKSIKRLSNQGLNCFKHNQRRHSLQTQTIKNFTNGLILSDPSNDIPNITLNDSSFESLLDSSLVIRTKSNLVYKSDILKLDGENRLNDSIINIYFELFDKNSPKKCLFLSTFAFAEPVNQEKINKCETKLDELIPNSFYNNNFYSKIRLDRSRHGGGLMVFIKNGIVCTKTLLLDETELIYFQIKIKSLKYNFVYCYRAPNIKEQFFLDKLDDFIHSLNLDEPLFIIGDLNMDLSTSGNSNINDFIKNNDLINFIQKPTRICTKFYKKTNSTKCSSTLIDLLLHNGDIVAETDVIHCPFSDHQFVVAKLEINKKLPIVLKEISCRNLSSENILKINLGIDEICFKAIRNFDDINEKWKFVKEEITKVIDEIAPVRKITLKNPNQFPWYDDDLIRLKHQKDLAYKQYRRTHSILDKEIYDNFNISFKKTNEEKLISYFKDKSMNDFKNSKKFWQYYSSKINVKSDKSNSNPITHAKYNGKSSEDRKDLCNIFNVFFTSISSSSEYSFNEASDFIEEKLVNNLKDENSEFKFSFTTADQIDELLTSIPSQSGPGISEIPTKIFKSSTKKLKTILAYLFNYSLLTNSVPNEWKTAVVTPLFKKKGSSEDLNNYRGISILPPVAKLFEKLLHKQILDYLNKNNIISDDQHGFRANYSCESALHEIISEINNIRSKRLIGLLLFIDFRKAFDTIDSQLLLIKLRKYGFSNSAINLIKSYFDNRVQFVKIDEFKSDPLEVKLGVPQGSVLGPLLFLVFINDIVSYLNEFTVKLFADDTTIIQTEANIEKLLLKFNYSVKKLVTWCKYNRIDVNWSKTKIMFISNKRSLSIPKQIFIENNNIEIVDCFKLLGVIIDNKMTFIKYVADLRKSINKRLYSIERLFYLSHKVRLQFLKSFILPYFDYCMSLSIYFPKRTLQKLANTYYNCIYKLLHINLTVRTVDDFNMLNIKLNKYNLECYQHRLIKRIARFIFKIYNNQHTPNGLKLSLVKNNENKTVKYNLRNNNNFYIPPKGKFNDHMEWTFTYFYSKFLNEFLIKDLDLEFNHFCKRIENNINLYFPRFCKIFIKFDLNFKLPYFN